MSKGAAISRSNNFPWLGLQSRPSSLAWRRSVVSISRGRNAGQRASRHRSGRRVTSHRARLVLPSLQDGRRSTERPRALWWVREARPLRSRPPDMRMHQTRIRFQCLLPSSEKILKSKFLNNGAINLYSLFLKTEQKSVCAR